MLVTRRLLHASSAFVLVAGLILLSTASAEAAAGDKTWTQGLLYVKRGDCVKAIPLLEQAERDKHRPAVAYALAGCYVKAGELLKASDMYHALSEEKVTRAFTRDDKAAVWNAKVKAAQVDARIPTIRFEAAEPYEDLEVEIDGVPVKDPEEPRKVAPDVRFTITARAKGRKELEETAVLQEKDRTIWRLRLEVGSPSDTARKKPQEEEEKPSKPKATSLGVRARGLIVPKFLMNAFGEGGSTIFIPGGDLTLTTSMADADLVVRAGYSSYRMAEVPFKLNGRPNTELEILESDMQAITATVSIIWSIPMDRLGRFNFRIGGGLGVGWMFAGNLGRTQAYPLGAPDDPASYVKCKGPNAPAGTFRYCNQLDKDADHYGGYEEPSWFSGGARPLIFPWLAVPELGFSWRMTPGTTMDLDLAVTVSGALAALGMRFGL